VNRIFLKGSPPLRNVFFVKKIFSFLASRDIHKSEEKKISPTLRSLGRLMYDEVAPAKPSIRNSNTFAKKSKTIK
jgi:hypothetical protein